NQLKDFSGIDKQHKIVLFVFLLGVITLSVGVLSYGWFIEEISAVFLITGILVATFGKLSIQETTDSFVQGAKDLIGTALIIALARGILIVASDGKIIDTLLYALSEPIRSLHPIVSSQAMFLVQSAINFFIPSGSGQAALTIPIMAPLGDLVGVSRQTAILAYQFGDGFSNLIIPTSAVTMGVLTLAEIPWEKWARWILPLIIILSIVSFLLLIPPYFIGW
ncbi:MAG: YfcC family protein, partial [Ignavibacteriae bacterium]|nr:YfcC family protein [Ignavibacteriota bacterium]